jgi:hypothetical protein
MSAAAAEVRTATELLVAFLVSGFAALAADVSVTEEAADLASTCPGSGNELPEPLCFPAPVAFPLLVPLVLMVLLVLVVFAIALSPLL